MKEEAAEMNADADLYSVSLQQNKMSKTHEM